MSQDFAEMKISPGYEDGYGQFIPINSTLKADLKNVKQKPKLTIEDDYSMVINGKIKI